MGRRVPIGVIAVEWGKTPSYGQRERIGYFGASTPPSGYDLAMKLRGLEAGSTYDALRTTASGLHPGAPIGYDVARDGGAVLTHGAMRADVDGDSAARG